MRKNFWPSNKSKPKLSNLKQHLDDHDPNHIRRRDDRPKTSIDQEAVMRAEIDGAAVGVVIKNRDREVVLVRVVIIVAIDATTTMITVTKMIDIHQVKSLRVNIVARDRDRVQAHQQDVTKNTPVIVLNRDLLQGISNLSENNEFLK